MGVDNGAPDFKTSLAMVRVDSEHDGERVASTPHITPGNRPKTDQRVMAAVANMPRLWRHTGSALSLVSSATVVAQLALSWVQAEHPASSSALEKGLGVACRVRRLVLQNFFFTGALAFADPKKTRRSKARMTPSPERANRRMRAAPGALYPAGLDWLAARERTASVEKDLLHNLATEAYHRWRRLRCRVEAQASLAPEAGKSGLRRLCAA